MRIAFDLDSTLIGDGFDWEPLPRGFLRRLLSAERLRLGTRGLVFELQQAGHEVWIYTTSFRSPRTVHATFWVHGIHVARVINQRRHIAMRAKLGDRLKTISKYPPAWQIDLLVDDSQLVVEEGRRFGFDVVHILPMETDWAHLVLDAVRTVSRRAA